MFEGFIEANTGEKLRIIRSDNTFGGEAALAFLAILTNYCLTPHEPNTGVDDMLDWFSEIQEKSGIVVCKEFDALDKVYYTGDWSNYSSGDYKIFMQRTGVNVSEFQFEEALKSVQQNWRPIQEVKQSVVALIDVFQQTSLKHTDWYNSKDTLGDFDGILRALEILEKRRATQVRIQFVL